MDNMDYSEDAVQIDKLNLDKECIRLPTDLLKFLNHSINLKDVVEERKTRLDVVEAEVAKDVRDHPAKFGIEKDTEKAIAAAVVLHPRYQEAVERLRKSKYAADMAEAVVRALEYKKRSLTLLVELHGVGYFSNPKLSRAGREAVEDMTKDRVRRRYTKEDR
jgi:hypothetical protein